MLTVLRLSYKDGKSITRKYSDPYIATYDFFKIIANDSDLEYATKYFEEVMPT